LGKINSTKIFSLFVWLRILGFFFFWNFSYKFIRFFKFFKSSFFFKYSFLGNFFFKNLDKGVFSLFFKKIYSRFIKFSLYFKKIILKKFSFKLRIFLPFWFYLIYFVFFYTISLKKTECLHHSNVTKFRNMV
jgi:hypothetical protein